MAETAHLYIYGYISGEPTMAEQMGAESQTISAKTITEFFIQNPLATKIVVHINSKGGDVNEGFAIYDLLSTSGREIKTIIEGMCASIATVPFMAGSEREITENSEMFIHNPWADPNGMTGFTAADYETKAAEIQIAEDKILNFYVKTTGYEKELLAAMMSKETSISAKEAKKYGFATKIITTTSNKIFALLTNKKIENMELKEMKTKINEIFNLVKTHIKGELPLIKNLDLKTKEGTILVIETELETVTIGDVVLIAGTEATDGNYELEDGTKLIVVAGKVTEIIPVDVANVATTEIVAATPEELKKENENLKADMNTQAKDIEEINSKLEILAKTVTTTFTPPTKTSVFNTKLKTWEEQNPRRNIFKEKLEKINEKK